GVLLAHFLGDALQVLANLAVPVGGQDGYDGHFDFFLVAGGWRRSDCDEHQQSRQEQDNHPHDWRHDLLPQTLGRPLRIGGYRGHSSLGFGAVGTTIGAVPSPNHISGTEPSGESGSPARTRRTSSGVARFIGN